MRSCAWRTRVPCLLLAAFALTHCREAPQPAPGAVNGSAQTAQTTCGNSVTKLSDVQGRGLASPLLGQMVSVEAVVTAIIPRLGGVFIQEEKQDRDGEPLTSEALFVLTDPKGVEIGQLIRVDGVVMEIGDESDTTTALGELKSLRVCAPADLPDMTLIEQAPLVTDDWEQYESMRVRFEPDLRLMDHYNLSRGEITVSADGRLYASTQLFAPGEAAQQREMDNERAQITLNAPDGSMASLRKFLDGAPSTRRPLRLGAKFAGVEGILDQREGRYRVHLEVAHLLPAPRPERPDLKQPELMLSSFNMLNLFNGDGKGGEFPTPRGATDAKEWRRQLDKSVAALSALRADVFVLNELENDGHEARSASFELLERLNRNMGGDYVQVVPPGNPLGGDQIRVGIIYRKSRVQPVDDAQTLTTAPFDRLNRPPLMQRFKSRSSGESFAVVAVHLKSKGGCEDAKDANVDRLDGQGCYNAVRVEAARALADWIESTLGESELRVAILGDFNAYALEDPMRLLGERGYQRLGGDREHSFVFRGVAGSLDHVVVSKALLPNVTRSAVWHINSDEMVALDYQLDDPSRAPLGDLYRPDMFRSSDHDPLMLGLSFKAKKAKATK